MRLRILPAFCAAMLAVMAGCVSSPAVDHTPVPALDLWRYLGLVETIQPSSSLSPLPTQKYWLTAKGRGFLV